MCDLLEYDGEEAEERYFIEEANKKLIDFNYSSCFRSYKFSALIWVNKFYGFKYKNGNNSQDKFMNRFVGWE